MSYAYPSVVIVHRTDPNTDNYGDPIDDGSETRTEIDGAIVAPRTAEEITGAGRSAVPIGKTVFLPPYTAIDAQDLVEIDGVEFSIDGEPAPWGNPYTLIDRGIEIAVKRVEG